MPSSIDAMSKYNCDGMFSNTQAAASEPTFGMKQLHIDYAYNLYLVKGSNLNQALDGLLFQLFSHIGESIFTDCNSNDLMIQELIMKSNSNSMQYPIDTVSCGTDKVSEVNVIEADCYQMIGRLNIYYTPLKIADQFDEELIYETTLRALENIMANSVLLTDTVISVHLDEREGSFKLRSAAAAEDSNGEVSIGNSASNSWINNNLHWIIGAEAALVTMIVIVIRFMTLNDESLEVDAQSNGTDDMSVSDFSSFDEREKCDDDDATSVLNDTVSESSCSQ